MNGGGANATRRDTAERLLGAQTSELIAGIYQGL